MGLTQRLALFRRFEEARGRPLITYVTSTRPNAAGAIASDAVGELLRQLEVLPPATKALDLLICSQGGDPTTAWRIVSLIRERVETFSVIVPQAAFSAATLIALGADEIVMHAHGNLGPVDPQIQVVRMPKEGPPQQMQFGYQDLLGVVRFAQDSLKLTEQTALASVLTALSGEIGTLPIGVATRGNQLSLTMGEKLLRLHMKDEAGIQRARQIIELLNRDFFHHGYPVSRSEAREIGLKVVDASAGVEELMWAIWLDLEDELELRAPWNPIGVVAAHPEGKDLFGPIPQIEIPQGLPPQAQAAILQQAVQSVNVAGIPAVPYRLIHAIFESTRLATRFITEGFVMAARQPDLQIRTNVVPTGQRWADLPIASV